MVRLRELWTSYKYTFETASIIKGRKDASVDAVDSDASSMADKSEQVIHFNATLLIVCVSLPFSLSFSRRSEMSTLQSNIEYLSNEFANRDNHKQAFSNNIADPTSYAHEGTRFIDIKT